MSTYTLVLQTVASLTGIATSTSLIIAFSQWRLAARNSQMSFEDSLAREYRQVTNRVPVRALLGESLSAEELENSLPAFYWYFDLTNEQVFLRRHRRVSDQTWASWADGIRRTMGRPAFAQAWLQIQRGPIGPFAELRRLAKAGFAEDPARWSAPATASQPAPQPAPDFAAAQPPTPQRRRLTRLPAKALRLLRAA